MEAKKDPAAAIPALSQVFATGLVPSPPRSKENGGRWSKIVDGAYVPNVDEPEGEGK